jgi:hypothetical protein
MSDLDFVELPNRRKVIFGDFFVEVKNVEWQA